MASHPRRLKWVDRHSDAWRAEPGADWLPSTFRGACGAKDILSRRRRLVGLASTLKLVAGDWARYNQATKWGVGVALDMKDRVSRATDANSIARSLQRLTRAARAVNSGPMLAARELRMRER